MTLNLILAKFKSPQLEKSYNQNYIKQDSLQAIIGIIILILLTIIFSYSDFILFKKTYKFFELVIVRLIFISISVAVVINFRKTQNVKMFNHLLLLFLLWECVFVFYINISRPPDYIQHGILDIIILMSMYVFFPNRFIFQIIPAILYTALDIWVILVFKEPLTPLANTVMWVSYLFANIIGVLAAWRLHIYRRKQFSAWLHEKQLKEELQEALGDVKKLQGLLPVCAKCKKIRNNKGYWEQIETYIEKHTEVEFSHGLCEDCGREMYGDKEWYKKMKKQEGN